MTSEAEEDLRSTAESLEADARRLAGVEGEKSELDVTDPRLAELSAEAERLATGIKHKATAERELTDEIQGER